jgi:hypothetical protein
MSHTDKDWIHSLFSAFERLQIHAEGQNSDQQIKKISKSTYGSPHGSRVSYKFTIISSFTAGFTKCLFDRFDADAIDKEECLANSNCWNSTQDAKMTSKTKTCKKQCR